LEVAVNTAADALRTRLSSPVADLVHAGYGQAGRLRPASRREWLAWSPRGLGGRRCHPGYRDVEFKKILVWADFFEAAVFASHLSVQDYVAWFHLAARLLPPRPPTRSRSA